MMILLLVALTGAHAGAAKLPSLPEQRLLTTAVAKYLKDPMSAKFRWQPKQPGGVYCGEVDAKNSYGGYIGFRPFEVFVGNKGGSFDPYGAFLADDDPQSPTSQTVMKGCLEAGFRFPDLP